MDETPRLAQDELEFEMYTFEGSIEELLNKRAEQDYVLASSTQIGLFTLFAFKKRQSEAR
jgi:hypothetical protein